MKYFVVLKHFLLAVIATIIFACVMQTQMVLFELTKLGIKISIAERLNMTWQDLLGLMPTYGIVILVGLVIGFGVCKIILQYTPLKSPILYVLSGGAVMAIILIAMQPVLGVTLVAGARSALGIVLQIVAGLLGGFWFMRMRTQQHSAN